MFHVLAAEIPVNQSVQLGRLSCPPAPEYRMLINVLYVKLDFPLDSTYGASKCTAHGVQQIDFN
jgi:hypothetical protein